MRQHEKPTKQTCHQQTAPSGSRPSKPPEWSSRKHHILLWDRQSSSSRLKPPPSILPTLLSRKLASSSQKYLAILGCDAAGIVEEVGSDLASMFEPGDRVIGQAGALQDYKYSAFQDYVVLEMPLLAKILDKAKFSDAVMLPLGVRTAASCLFEPEMLGLELPPGRAGHGKTLLVWGASSSVGSCGVQLATAAGYEVFAVASERNHSFVRSIALPSASTTRTPTSLRPWSKV